MHPQRWGDPAAAAALPEGARALVEAVFGAGHRPPSRSPAPLPAAGAASPTLLGGARATRSATAHVLTDDDRAGCAPAASRRPTCCAPAPAT